MGLLRVALLLVAYLWVLFLEVVFLQVPFLQASWLRMEDAWASFVQTSRVDSKCIEITVLEASMKFDQ